MSTLAGSTVSSPAWVGPVRAHATPPPPAVRPVGRAPGFEVRGRGAGGLLLLALGWIVLWAFFLLAVVEPAAALRRERAQPPEPAAPAVLTAR